MRKYKVLLLDLEYWTNVGNQEKTHFFLSHNATPFYSQKLKDKAKQFKLQNAKSIISETSDNNILGMLHKWRNPVFQKQDLNEIIDTSIKNISRTTIKVYNLTQPHSLSKSDLNHAKVIGQVDCKFIACLIPKIEKFQSRNLIVLFDQHAVHERIRLEKLIKDSYENNSEEQNVKSSSLDVPISVHLRPEEMRMLKAYECHLEKIGLKVTVDDDSIRVHSVPSCLFEKISNESKKKTTRINTIVENLLQEWMEITQLTGNKISSLPKTLLNVLNSQACRSAIKFGDLLSKDECRKLLGLLTLCKLPFQCAHGRPDLVPVADLDHLKKLEPLMQKPQLQKLTERLRRNKSPNQKTDSVTSCK
ncbi:DNA mismatch repair protein Mlh3-like [Centruroides sculpturatus]|uniref:DNA mismatch repair protein Mlh3-like n=1 Tax=Centruroides sculpturatus TaxID=218467 RepID=UPI000C6C9C42|nr:DNA mismatch repair protein Mlh3-like [Centruroides sculpturatus]